MSRNKCDLGETEIGYIIILEEKTLHVKRQLKLIKEFLKGKIVNEDPQQWKMM